MYTCKKAAELIEKEESQQLSFVIKLRLKMHLAMCSACSNYKKQSQLLSELIKKRIDSKPDEIKLSESSKERIIKKMKKKES